MPTDRRSTFRQRVQDLLHEDRLDAVHDGRRASASYSGGPMRRDYDLRRFRALVPAAAKKRTTRRS